MTLSLAGCGVLDATGVTVAAPKPADLADLELVHDPGYIGIVRQVPANVSYYHREFALVLNPL